MFYNYLHLFSFKTPSKRAELSEQKCTGFASSILNGVKNVCKYYHFLMKNVYPFDMMDTFVENESLDYMDSYTIPEDITPFQYLLLLKICESIKLDNSDYIYLESLSKIELMKFIRLYNDTLHN